MPLVINTNTAALAAMAGLARGQDALDRAVQRLSTGLRVNSAKDDAAGLAIAARMTARARGAHQAARNANDGISLFQTGDQALASMAERLQHMRELALQALNGTATSSDRAALDRDVQASRSEVDRVAAAASFNGKRLLDGSSGIGKFQIGAERADVLEVDLSASLRTAKLGAIATATSTDLRTLSGSGGLAFAGTYTTTPLATLDFSKPELAAAPGSTLTTGTPATNYAGAGNAATISVDGHAVTLSANYGTTAAVAGAIQSQLNAAAPGNYLVTAQGAEIRFAHAAGAAGAASPPAVAGVGGAGAGAFDGGTPTAGNPAQSTTHAGFAVDGNPVAIVTDYTGNPDGLVADIQDQLDHDARGAYRVGGGAAGVSITRIGAIDPPRLGDFTGIGASAFGHNVQVQLTLARGDLSIAVGSGPAVDVTGSFGTPQELAQAIQDKVPGVMSVHVGQFTGRLTINAARTITMGGAASSGEFAFARLVNPPTGSLDDAAVRNTDVADDTVLRLDVAIDQVARQRGDFGATLARLDATVALQQEQESAASAARGRIVDADFAGESAELTRAEVLQRAGAALVAQANASPEQVLELLRP
jgi:flagellin